MMAMCSESPGGRRMLVAGAWWTDRPTDLAYI